MRLLRFALVSLTLLSAVCLGGCRLAGDAAYEQMKLYAEAKWAEERPKLIEAAEKKAIEASDKGIDAAERAWQAKIREIEDKAPEERSEAEKWMLYASLLSGGGAFAFTSAKTASRALIGAAAAKAANGGPHPPEGKA